MRIFFTTLVLTTFIIISPGDALASGFAIAEQSVKGLGNAFAGSAASAEDASTIFHNPACMTNLEGKQIAAGVHLVIPKAEFNDSGSAAVSSIAVPGLSPTPAYNNFLTGGNGGDSGGAFPVPNLYYVNTFDNKWSVGLGINVPFGLSTEYEQRWVGRYYGVSSKLQTININPSAAYKFSDKFSFGFGVSAQYLKAELSNAVDFGTLDTLGFFDTNLGDGTKDPVFGLAPQGNDGFTEASGDSWGYGFNIGIMFNINNKRRLGIAYRSGISHEVKGDVTWILPTTSGFNLAMAAASPNGMFQNGGVKVDVDLPASASMSYYHGVNEKFAVMADITWTEWSVVDKLILDYDDDTSNGVTTFSWEDTLRYSVGVLYHHSDKTTLRCGLAYDETPIPSKEIREVRVPGEDRLWFTAGGSYKFTNSLTLDAAYAYITTPDSPEIDKTGLANSSEHAAKGLLHGEYSAYVNIFSLQLNYIF